MCNRGRTNDDGKCRFHPSIQLYLRNRNGNWAEIMKDCPLCSAFKSISSKSNPLLTTPQKSSRFNELKTGDELPASASTKNKSSTSSTSCVIPMTYDRIAIQRMMFPPLPLSTSRHDDSGLFDSTLAVCRMNDEVCYANGHHDSNNLMIQEVSQLKNSILTTPRKSSRFSELKDGDEQPSSASNKNTNSSSPTTCVIPMTHDRLLATQMIPPVPPLSSTSGTKSTLTHTSSLPQNWQDDSNCLDSTLSVCRINDEICYVNKQKDCLKTMHVNKLIKEASQSMRLLTRSNSQPTSSTTKSSFSRSEDDHRHKLSNYNVPVSCIERRSSTGSHMDFGAPSLSASSTSQESSFSSCDSLGRCIYHPNIQLKTQRTYDGRMAEKCCSKCAFEKVQRLRRQILLDVDQMDSLDVITKLTDSSCNIMNILTCSEKDLKRIVRSSCEIDRSDYTDSTCEIDRSYRTDDTHRLEGQSSKGSRHRVSFASRDDIMY